MSDAVLGIYLLGWVYPDRCAYYEGAYYEEARSMIVIAKSHRAARMIAAEAAADEGKQFWLTVAVSTCKIVGHAVPGAKPGLLVRDVRNG